MGGSGDAALAVGSARDAVASSPVRGGLAPPRGMGHFASTNT